MRRIRTLGVLAVTALLALSGCAGTPASVDLVSQLREGQADELGLLTGKPYDSTRIRLLSCCKTAAQFSALQKRTAGFTARTGIEVEWANIPYESYLQKIVAESAVGGGTYDLIVWPDAYGASAKVGLQPLDDALARAGRSIADFPPPFQQAARAGDADTVYGIPFRGFSYNYFYRKSDYTKLGLTPATTWAELDQRLDALKQGQERNPLAGQYGRNGGQNLYTWLSMLWSNGADVFDANGEPAFDTPAGIEATEQYMSVLRRGFSPPESTNWSETDSTQSFEQGASSSVFTWAWQMDDFSDPEKVKPEVAQDVGVAPIPGWPGKTTVSYGFTWLMGVLNTSENQGAAWEYLKWVTHPETERDIALDKSDPATANSIVVHTANMLDPEVNAANFGLPRLQESSLRTARTVPMTIDWPQVQDALEVAVNEMAHGAPVPDRLKALSGEVRDLVKR
ncbi:ABC transporter substrate-binding protein [Amycolatopsis sp. 195334CR]|uniref:ABC transporter substrate-binding protein n=1 Tax=Amycolatopsis sp. 195334CR TaxID=2814588 RepID=UPI001A8CA080|nr:sugar ABC transporter substrate-binding protein [Amycolatopsis sp. 195334CR]MBN6040487.1 sugar ABC transporter substrate-binding protein [Amycolatopsis sp. 195334CR]